MTYYHTVDDNQSTFSNQLNSLFFIIFSVLTVIIPVLSVIALALV